MKTYVYMVRHAESPYIAGAERTRGLSRKGQANVKKVTEILMDKGIEVVISSPYARAVLTVEDLAHRLGLEVETYEDLRERCFAGEDYILSDENFMDEVMNMFHNPDYSLPGGESNAECQVRAVSALQEILEKYRGTKIALGTHGNVMTMMLNHFDDSYDLEFLKQTSKPDIYRLEFEGHELIEVSRLWKKREEE